jgi:hypothetical protein
MDLPILSFNASHGVRGGAAGLGNALQAGRSRVRLGFFIDLIHPAAHWP